MTNDTKLTFTQEKILGKLSKTEWKSAYDVGGER